MPRKLMLVISLILIFSLASADIYVLSPVEVRAKQGQVVEIGKAQPGETAEIIFSDNAGLSGGIKWDKAAIAKESLPSGWEAVDSAAGGKTLSVLLGIPKDVEPNLYNLKVELSSSAKGIAPQYINARLLVSKGLIVGGIERKEPKTEVPIGEPVSYVLTLNNQSIARHNVVLSSSLSSSWFRPEEFSIGPGETIQKELILIPRVQGIKSFSFLVSSAMYNEEAIKKEFLLDIKPTIKGKYSAALFGFPFYTMTLFPYYFLNSLISALIP